MKVGKIIKNKNGIDYTVLAVSDNSALLHGGHDYVVIRDLSYFEKSGSWGGGTYFPCFEDGNSYKMLRRALHYFKHYSYIEDEIEIEDDEEF